MGFLDYILEVFSVFFRNFPGEIPVISLKEV